MLVLGLDPGSRVLGYGLVDWGAAPTFITGGTIVATKRDAPGARVAEIGGELMRLLVELRPRGIERVGIESGFFGKGKKSNPKTDLMLANARGAVLFVVATVLQVEPIWINPTTTKIAATGNGKAEKDEIQTAIKRILRMKVRPGPDVADACAVAIATAGAG